MAKDDDDTDGSALEELVAEAGALIAAGSISDAGPILTNASAMAERTPTPDRQPAAFFRLADLLRTVGDNESALHIVELLLAGRLDDDARLLVEATAGVLLQSLGRSAEALRHLESAATLIDEETTPELAVHVLETRISAMARLAQVLVEQGQLKAAVRLLKERLELAAGTGDALQMAAAYGDLAGARGKDRDYAHALHDFRAARSLLRDLPAPEAAAALTHTESMIESIERFLGEDLLDDLSARLGQDARAALMDRSPPEVSDWSVLSELDVAVRSAANILSQEDEAAGLAPALPMDDLSTMQMVGELARRELDDTAPDPPTLVGAARYLLQIDRTRRAQKRVRTAEAGAAGLGPFGGGTSKHVLYMRSFEARGRLPGRDVEPWGHVDLEEILAIRLAKSPLVALGRTDLARFGPGHAPTTSGDWQPVLRALAAEAQMILVIPAATEGTSWEIEWVVLNKFLHKSWFVMPPADETHRAWWTANWGALRARTARLGLELPEYSAEGCLFRFTIGRQIQRYPFATLLEWGPDLHTDLMMRMDLYADGLYTMKKALFEHGGFDDESPIEVRLRELGLDDLTPTAVDALLELEDGARHELSGWELDTPQATSCPGVLALWRDVINLMWVEAVDNVVERIDGHAAGRRSAFTRAAWNFEVAERLTPDAASQVLEDELAIEEVVGLWVRDSLAYSFACLSDPRDRAAVVEAVTRGVLGSPPLYAEAE